MLGLAEAALIAKLVYDGVAAFDKMFRGYADFIKKKEPSASSIPPPDYAYVNAPEENALVARSRHTGITYQRVTYDELRRKLDGSDREYVETLSKALESYQHQWNVVYQQRAMAGGMELGRLDVQLEYLVQQIADPLIRLLDFIERLGFQLDDHYEMSRELTKKYLKDTQR